MGLIIHRRSAHQGSQPAQFMHDSWRTAKERGFDFFFFLLLSGSSATPDGNYYLPFYLHSVFLLSSHCLNGPIVLPILFPNLLLCFATIYVKSVWKGVNWILIKHWGRHAYWLGQDEKWIDFNHLACRCREVGSRRWIRSTQTTGAGTTEPTDGVRSAPNLSLHWLPNIWCITQYIGLPDGRRKTKTKKGKRKKRPPKKFRTDQKTETSLC